MQGLAVIGGLAGAFAADGDVDAVIAEDALQERHIGKARHVIEGQRLVSQEARDHQRQGGVFRARDRYRAVKPAGAENANAIHEMPPCGPLAEAQTLIAAPIAAKVGSLRLCRGSPRRWRPAGLAVLATSPRLRFAAFEVFT